MLRQLSTKIIRPLSANANLVSARFQSSGSQNNEDLLVETKDQVLWLKFNRPNKYNALKRAMYEQIIEQLNNVNKNKDIKAVVLTGVGDYYSSGNDLTNFNQAMAHPDGPKAGLSETTEILYRYVQSFINLDKFLVAAINGPAVGIAVSTLPLCDYVIASDKATFQTPFTALGQCPEGCSSQTFPELMGQSRASEMLLMNMTWDARKAQTYGLVSEVVEHAKFNQHLDALIYKGIVAKCYPNSLMKSKFLTRNRKRDDFSKTNRLECDTILDLWLGPECADALQKFFSRGKQ